MTDQADLHEHTHYLKWSGGGPNAELFWKTAGARAHNSAELDAYLLPFFTRADRRRDLHGPGPRLSDELERIAGDELAKLDAALAEDRAEPVPGTPPVQLRAAAFDAAQRVLAEDATLEAALRVAHWIATSNLDGALDGLSRAELLRQRFVVSAEILDDADAKRPPT